MCFDEFNTLWGILTCCVTSKTEDDWMLRSCQRCFSYNLSTGSEYWSQCDVSVVPSVCVVSWLMRGSDSFSIRLRHSVMRVQGPEYFLNAVYSAVIWWSCRLQLRFASGMRCALLCVHCPHSESSERRSVLVLWPGCYQRVFTAQRGKTATQLLRSPLFSFLHLCRSLRVMQMHRPYPPHLYFKSLLPSVNGLCSGLAESGKVEWMKTHCISSHQCPTVSAVFSNQGPLKLFSLAAAT